MAIGIDKAVTGSTVLVLGASSQIGVFVIPRLVAAGLRVFAVSRKGRPAYFPHSEQVEWLDRIDGVAGKHVEYLLSAGPITLAHEALEADTQLRSAVVFSSTSVITKQDSPQQAERMQIQDILDQESALETLASKRGFRLVILRPTLIYGCGMDTNISRLAGWAKRYGFIPVNGKASGLRQPVHADDLAIAAVAALLNKESLPRYLVLAGGSTLSYADMVSRVFAALGKRSRLLQIPEWLFIFLVRLLVAVRPALGINAEMVRRQSVDLVFDDSQARVLLAYQPRPFKPSEKDFLLPEFD